MATGELVVDRLITNPTTVYGYQSQYGRAYAYSPDRVPLKKQLGVMPICDILASTENSSATFSVGQYGGATSIYFIYLNEDYTSVADYNAWLAENNPTIVLWLATPQTYQLTPQEVRTLLGTNNVWSDGDVSVTYKADVKLYVDKQLNGNTTTANRTSLNMTKLGDSDSNDSDITDSEES